MRSKNDLISLEIVTFFKPLVAEGQILAKKPKKAIDLFIAFCLEKKSKSWGVILLLFFEPL